MAGGAAEAELTLTGTDAAQPAPPRRPIRRETLHAQVVEKLRRLISRGDIVAGERINELEIAAVFWRFAHAVARGDQALGLRGAA